MGLHQYLSAVLTVPQERSCRSLDLPAGSEQRDQARGPSRRHRVISRRSAGERSMPRDYAAGVVGAAFAAARRAVRATARVAPTAFAGLGTAAAARNR